MGFTEVETAFTADDMLKVIAPFFDVEADTLAGALVIVVDKDGKYKLGGNMRDREALAELLIDVTTEVIESQFIDAVTDLAKAAEEVQAS